MAIEGGHRKLQRYEHNFRWVENARIGSGEVEISSAPVDAERCNIIATRMADIQEVSIWLDSELTRIVAARPEFALKRGRPGSLVNGEKRNAVGQAIRGVYEPTVGADMNFRGVIRTLVRRGQTLYRLLQRQRSSGSVISHEVEGRSFLVDNVDPLPVLVEVEVA